MNKKTIKGIGRIILMVILMSIITPFSVFAAQKNETVVKVGFCRIDGFFDLDKSGKRSGYGVDVLNAISEKTNLKFEYVDVKDWEDLHDMLMNGEIDIKMPMAIGRGRVEGVGYSSESVIYTYETLMAKQTREDLHYEDFETLSQSRVAMVPSAMSNPGVRQFFAQMKNKPTFIYCDTFNQCKRAVDEERADMLLSNIMDNRKDLKILARFGASDSFIAMRQGDERLRIINHALSEKKLSDPGYFSKLEEKYYPLRNLTPLTEEESEFVSKQQVINVAVYMEDKPMAYLDEATGKLMGINVDLIHLIREKTGLNLKIIPVYETADMKTYLDSGRADLVFPGDGTLLDVAYTSDSVMQSTVTFAAIDGVVAEKGKGLRVGVVKNNLNTIGTMKRGNPEMKLTEYNNNEECFDALQRGDVDILAKNSFAMSYLLQQPRYANVRTLSYLALQNNWSFTGKGNGIVGSVMGKGIAAITEGERNQITERYTILMPYEKTIWDNLYQYRYGYAFGLIFILLLVFLFFWYAKTKSRFMHQLEAKNLELEGANAAKGRFLSNISHDMRTPMNVIMGLTTLAMEDEKNSVNKGYLADIHSSSVYLLGLINDVLDMAKMESGKFSLSLAPVEYEEFRQAVLRTVGPLAAGKEVEFHLIEEGEMIPIVADKLRINQLFFNLISNAVKFTPKGGEVQFIIKNKGVQQGIVTFEFTVRDNGIGMSEEFQQSMFSAFAREERSIHHQIEGTGLGLSIVKSIVEKMDGTMTVISKLGEGTTFVISLSFLAASKESVTQRQEEEFVGSLKDRQVLLAEDHPLNMIVATGLLEKVGIKVFPVENGEEAVKAIEASDEGFFDAVLMDIQMPVMDGLMATQKIRILDRDDGKIIPIIAMTASAYHEDIRASLEAGMNGHVAKPIEPNILYSTLSRLMGKEKKK